MTIQLNSVKLFQNKLNFKTFKEVEYIAGLYIIIVFEESSIDSRMTCEYINSSALDCSCMYQVRNMS